MEAIIMNSEAKDLEELEDEDDDKDLDILRSLEFNVNRPEIKLENIDLNKFPKGDLTTDGLFYEGISIPLKFSDSDRVLWEMVWFFFIDEYADVSLEGREDDIIPDQPINLQLFIDDDPRSDERSYKLSALINVDDYGNIVPECLMEEIHLTDEEIEAVNKALSEAPTYVKKDETPVINKPKLSLRELCDKYRDLTDETTAIEPDTFTLYKELRELNYKDIGVCKSWEAKKTRPCFGITHFKKIRYKRNGSNIQLTNGKSWFLICDEIESIEKTREFGNFQDVFTIKFSDCEEPLELLASWYGNEID